MRTGSASETKPVTYLTAPTALEAGLRLGGAGVWRWLIDSEQLEWTSNLESIHRLPHGSFDGTLTSFQLDVHPDDAGYVWNQIRTSVTTGLPYRAVYRTAPRLNQSEIWIETSGGVTTDPDGSRYLTGVCIDVTERVRNEHKLERKLVQQNAVSSFGSFALHEQDFQKVLEEAVRVAGEVLQVPLTKILEFSDSADHLVLRAGIGWAEGLVGKGEVGIERASQAGYTLLADEPVIVADMATETRFSGPQLLHDHDVLSGMSVVIPGPTTRAFGVFGIHAREVRSFDETDAGFLQSLANIVAGAARQAAATEHQVLLVREMTHRSANLMQLINSIAGQTFKADCDLVHARKTFSDRLGALARANLVITRGGWTSTRFAELIEEALNPFGNRVVTVGRDILLPPELSFDMGLVLHELATNSVKYGALGTAAERVDITWSYDRQPDGSSIFKFIWNDPVSNNEKSEKGTGFGSKLIGALIENKWNGVVAIKEDASFKLTFEIPLPD